MQHPTRRKKQKKASDDQRQPTAEERAWPDEARVLSVMAHGFSYSEAWHMSYRDYNRYTGLAAAWSIPYDQRDGIVRRATAEDIDTCI